MSHVHVKGVKTTERNEIIVEVGELFDNGIYGTGEPVEAILIPVDAVASRMHAYGVKTPEEAIEAILKEHAVNLHGLKIKEHEAASPKYKSAGGLAPEVEVSWANGTKSQRDKVLKTHASRIKSEHKARAPKETTSKRKVK